MLTVTSEVRLTVRTASFARPSDRNGWPVEPSPSSLPRGDTWITIATGAGRTGIRMVVKMRLELGGSGFSKAGMSATDGICATAGAAEAAIAATMSILAKLII